MVSRLHWFWQWYERYYLVNVTVATVLFILQVVHLYWLATTVIALRLLGFPLWQVSPFGEYVIIAVDYLEIPALLGVSLVYVNELRQKFSWRPVFYLGLLLSQWLHILWITDEFVVDALVANSLTLPVWLAWLAILIDYLEVPVMLDTARRTVAGLRRAWLVVTARRLNEEGEI